MFIHKNISHTGRLFWHKCCVSQRKLLRMFYLTEATVLWPISFFLYFNDTTAAVNSQIRMLNDNSVVYR